MRPSSRRRRRAAKQTETPEPLARLRRRCTGGAVVAGAAYLAVLTTSTLRPTALRGSVAIGLLFAFCGLGAIFTRAMSRVRALSDNERQAEELKWAIRFGEELADAFHATSSDRR